MDLVTRSASRRITITIGLLLATLSTTAAIGAQKPATAETHKAWMNDAADAQEDFRGAIAVADAKAAAAALTKIEDFMAKTEAYWAAKKMADGVKLARAARAHASTGSAEAKKGMLAGATGAFEKMNATCNACHELHLEKR